MKKVRRCAAITRRDLLQGAGYAIAAAAFPSMPLIAGQSTSSDATQQPVSSVMNKLSAYMAEASGHALPDGVVENAKQHILDTFAALISGSELPPGRAALQFVRAYGGKEGATGGASNIVCGPIEAAPANGGLAPAHETHHPHGPSPPPPRVSPVP